MRIDEIGAPVPLTTGPAPRIGERAPRLVVAASSPTLEVSSEIGPLRRVIVHRPGRELHRLTPANHDELLFDDVVWVERAAEEHDALTAAMRERGVEVLLLQDLLAQTLCLADARTEVIERTLELAAPGPTLVGGLREWLSSLPAEPLAELLIAGVSYEELPFHSRSLPAQTADPSAFVLTPLPNHLYTRDASAWAYGGVSIHRMALPARRREALHYEAIYRHHPLFAEIRHEIWSHEFDGEPELEGGDLLVIGHGTVLAGMGERSKPAAVEAYARRLFEAGAAERVIGVGLPASRATIHLDTVLTQVDHDAFTAFAPLLPVLETYVLTPAPGGVRSERAPSLEQAIREALGREVRMIHGDDPVTAEREQWDEGNNVLALSPGTVLAYERNRATNDCLRAAGIEVIEIPGTELNRGRGGARCLTCPIERAPA